MRDCTGNGHGGVMTFVSKSEREPIPDKRERIAQALYEASMGTAAILPWPCSNADTYRRLADAAIEAYERA